MRKAIWTESVLTNAELVHDYTANSLMRDSEGMDCIKAAVKEAGILVVLGYSERQGARLYIARSLHFS